MILKVLIPGFFGAPLPTFHPAPHYPPISVSPLYENENTHEWLYRALPLPVILQNKNTHLNQAIHEEQEAILELRVQLRLLQSHKLQQELTVQPPAEQAPPPQPSPEARSDEQTKRSVVTTVTSTAAANAVASAAAATAGVGATATAATATEAAASANGKAAKDPSKPSPSKDRRDTNM